MGKKPRLTTRQKEHVKHFGAAIDRSVARVGFRAKDKKFLKSRIIQGGKSKD